MENGSFVWGSLQNFTLNDINFKIPKGGLYALVGPVGSGMYTFAISVTFFFSDGQYVFNF